MKKILPVNQNPYMRPYTHHAFFHAISSTYDKYAQNDDGIVADITVNNFSVDEWKTKVGELNYVLSPDNHLLFKSNKWNQNMNFAFYKNCGKNEEISLTIYQQIYSNAWSSINAFLIDEQNDDILNLNSYDVSFGNFAKDGIFYSTERGFHNRIMPNLSYPLTITFKKDDKKIYMRFCSKDYSSKEMLIFTISDEKKYNIGFGVYLGNSDYTNFVFSNYVNIGFNANQGIQLDYMFNRHKDWVSYTTNPLFDYHYIKEKELNLLGIARLDYIKKQIDLSNYIELELNDNINFNCSDDNGTFFHQNLIYGYDDEKQCLYSLYVNHGKLELGSMPYDIFDSERNYKQGYTIYVLKYNPSYESTALHVRRMLQLFKEYKTGDNFLYYEPQYEEGYVIGLPCYKSFTTNDGLNYVMSDIRISHLLYERAICNLDRIEYFYYLKHISQEDYAYMKELLEKQIQVLVIIRNRIVKSRLGKKVDISIIHDYMLNVYNIEEKFTDKMICSLSKLIE